MRTTGGLSARRVLWRRSAECHGVRLVRSSPQADCSASLHPRWPVTLLAMAGIEIGACPNIARGPLFLPYWPPPSWEKRLAPAQPRSLFRHDKSPTSKGSAEVPGASRQLNNRLGRRAWQKYGKGSATAPGCMRHNIENICACAPPRMVHCSH